MSTAHRPATVADLLTVDGKAELIDGTIVYLAPTGYLPGQIALEIVLSLTNHVRASGLPGVTFGDNTGFVVPPLQSGRESFSPDAAYFDGPPPANRMRFVNGPPKFAVEVRSEGDYGPAAELELTAERTDYFKAGTKVVWDVDPIDQVVRVYKFDSPTQPVNFARGSVADAEPAVAGWRVAVDELFRAR